MIGSIPNWVNAFSLTLHMVATVVWIGGLLFYAIVLFPVLRLKQFNLSPIELLRQLRRRFQPLAWFSLALLIVTGLFQMTASPEYQGFLSLEGGWAKALFSKHIAVIGMVLLASYQTWSLNPQIERSWLEHKAGKALSPENNEKLLRTQTRLLSLNAFLGVVVLALTALAQSS